MELDKEFRRFPTIFNKTELIKEINPHYTKSRALSTRKLGLPITDWKGRDFGNYVKVHKVCPSKDLRVSSSFWLPTVTITREKIVDLNSRIDKILLVSPKKADKYSSHGRIELPSIQNESVTHVCSLLNRKIAVILSTKLLIARKGENAAALQVLETIPMRMISKVMTDPNMRIVELLLKPEANRSSIRLIPGEIEETESFINFLLIASRKVTQSKSTKRKYWYSPWTVFLEVIQYTSLLNLPSSIPLKNYFKSASADTRSLYTALALVSSLENAISHTQEFMVQRGIEPFLPAKAHLTRSTMHLLIIGESSQLISIPLHELSSIARVEIPRPYSCSILWNSITLYLAASSGSIGDEWFERICHAKRKLDKITSPQVAHVIIADSTLHIFSAESNKLLVRTPLLNIVVPSIMSEQEYGNTLVIIEIETLEAEEIISHENERWTLQFLSTTDASSFYHLIINLKSNC